ncbi:MAG: NAD-binding protein [Gammaproteobacteria bacterium]|nr:NAD-binding protein [Gammaproteobacteria bacterium]MCW8992271.1 NAD-binding protein [Gammaproteobacteria bacterium]
MNQVIFLILRRMRAPLVVVIVAYAVSIFGLVVIPGSDADGNPWRMGFFHAFYFVSYMATTIGFGEIPYEFTDGQRMWTMASVYLTVIAWLYAIGKILSLIQDSAFRQAVVEQSFARGMRHMAEPFYIVCGYGDTGSLLVRAMTQRGMRAVVVDHDQERINALELADLDSYVPGLCADASLSLSLKEAGLVHKQCAGVVALTDNDQVNLKIAITTKLLHPGIKVICRAETHDVGANMASFGTDRIINPYDTFASRLALALHSPGTHLLYEWLTGVPETPLPVPLYPPRGSWVLCGYGRFGKAVKENLDREGVDTVIVEADPDGADCRGFCVVGRGTEAETLRAAGVEQAVGIVAGTDNDANNLSITMTAAELNPDLFMVARQNKSDNDDTFQAALLDLVMQRSEIIARDIFAMLTTPLLDDFLHLILKKSNAWANEQISRLTAVIGETVPDIWYYLVDEVQTPALCEVLEEDETAMVGDLLRDPREREEPLSCLPLLLLRKDGEEVLFPAGEEPLQVGDQLLFAGKTGAHERMKWILQNHNALHYVRTGEEQATGYVWQLLRRLRAG